MKNAKILKKVSASLLALLLCVQCVGVLPMTVSAASDDMGWGDIVLGAGTIKTTGKYDKNEMKQNAIQAAEEGIVMVKNENNALPLRPADKVAVIGAAQIWKDKDSTYGYHFGGIGSGAMWGAPEKSPLEALKDEAKAGKFTLYQPFVDGYESNAQRFKPDYAAAKAAGVKKAIVFLTRYNGEQNNENNQQGDMQPTGSYQGWYLTRAEEQMLKDAKANFEQVIVVINSGNIVDTDWIKNGLDGKQVADAALFSWYGGTYGATALADILSGDATPSGKLADTAANLDKYPSTEDMKNAVYAAYTEDVFVGYRYFETFNVPVNYEFGYGMSYTKFEMSNLKMTSTATHITVKVTVKNTGNYAGKEVVQAYFSAPQKGTGSAKLAKPAKELAGYAKTDLLQPGQSQEVTVKFPISELASYDDTGVTGKKAAWVMEAGDYKILVGNSVKNVKQAGTYKQNGLKVVEQLTTKLTPQALDKRMTWDGSGKVAYENLTTGSVASPKLPQDTSKGQQNYGSLVKYSDVASGKKTVQELVSQMTIEELASFTVATKVSNGAQNSGIGGSEDVKNKYGVPILGTADGPAGPSTGIWAYPCETALACTWNLDILANYGTIAGKYAGESGTFWLAPGANMHRNPLGGRNFEYFSEDALITGLCAATITVKAQALGLPVAVKHYVANDKELQRGSCDSRVSERAMREVYLRPFEFLAKVGKAASFMMGYNVVNGTQIHSYQELLELPREEWGWDGMYMSDWQDLSTSTTEAYIAGSNIACGDLSKGTQSGTLGDYIPIVDAFNAGKINRTVLENNAATVINAILKHTKPVTYKNVGYYDATGKVTGSVVATTTKPNGTTKPNATTTVDGGTNKTTTVQGQTTTTVPGQTTTTVVGGDDPTVELVVQSIKLDSTEGDKNTYVITFTNGMSMKFTLTTAADGTEEIANIPDDTWMTDQPTVTIEDGYWYLDGVSSNVKVSDSNEGNGTTQNVPTTTTGSDGDQTDTAPKGGSMVWLYVLIGVVVLGGAAVAVILVLKKKKTEPVQENNAE